MVGTEYIVVLYLWGFKRVGTLSMLIQKP